MLLLCVPKLTNKLVAFRRSTIWKIQAKLGQPAQRYARSIAHQAPLVHRSISTVGGAPCGAGASATFSNLPHVMQQKLRSILH